MRGSNIAATLLFIGTSSYVEAADSKQELKPCSVLNSVNGHFYDLSAISVFPPKENSKKAHKDEKVESWHARGWDYGSNFTLNICAPIVEPLDDVIGIKDGLLKNVSAFYTVGSKTYSIGESNDRPFFRGRKLQLNYTNGSPCDDSDSRLKPRSLKGSDDDKDDEKDGDDKKHESRPSHSSSSSSSRRKSTIISFICDRDSLSQAHFSFIAASPDECTYFFEAKSPAACGDAIVPQQSINAGGVFTVIAIIAVAVYLLGGIAYQRTVMHQRGWRQLPNYGLWAGIFSFVSDMTMILCGSCLRFIPKRRGYDRLNGGGIGGGRNGGLRGSGRGSRTQEENGLIDSLDEEWND